MDTRTVNLYKDRVLLGKVRPLSVVYRDVTDGSPCKRPPVEFARLSRFQFQLRS